MNEIFGLFIAFQIKHFLADYPLQTKYMLGKFAADMDDWVPPLAAHALVHALGTYVIAWYFRQDLGLDFPLALLDALVHMTVDRIKASPNLLGRFKPDNKYFWWALGADQMMHHLTHYAIIYLLLTVE